MGNQKAENRLQNAGIDDVLLAVLGLVAGPLLWWISQTWQANPAASSVQTLEYWIAVLCGFIGIGLSGVWVLFLVAGLGFALALRTKNKVLSYWSGLFTPKFLQRIIISVLGLQLTLGSQAFAAEESATEPTASATAVEEHPFQPEIAELPPSASETGASVPSVSPLDVPSSPSRSTTAIEEPTQPEPSISPQPRQTSLVAPKTAPVDAPASDQANPAAEPSPRQTTTIPVPADTTEPRAAQPETSETYVPEKPSPSPYIATPNPDRTTEAPSVVVQSGDSLWDLAHQELGADATLTQIDQRWRHWWEHNHDVIGDDPHTLSPGLVLVAPPFTH